MVGKVSNTSWQSIQGVLDEVLELPLLEQTRYLKKHCHCDTSLYRNIKALLKAEREAPDFLDQPALNFAQTLLENGSLSEALNNIDCPQMQDFKNTRIGPYQLCEEIGRGGMGVVYRAERRQGDFEQEVAIKLLWSWEDRNGIIERFQREQQLLASLTHPNIAQLYDGGLTPAGQPYFVMEYVQGVPINQYCDDKSLGVNARLRLLLQVAKALGFAHKHLIVHRDIKPSNIFVTMEGEVKLLDFGVAKWLSEQNNLELTQTGDHILTPGFSAPEQLQNKPITVATDVYQLGLVGYELLTGRQAFRDQASSFAELVRLMSEQLPTCPSVIVGQVIDHGQRNVSGASQDVTCETLSADRGTSVKGLQKKLQGDLDAIIFKMLQNDPARRYMSMEMFQSDLDAYFNLRPIVAQNQSIIYQTKKFIQRRWRYLLIVAVFIVLLLGYAFTATYQAKQTRLALEQSRLEKSKAQGVSEFLVNVFKAADPNVSGLQTITAQALLEQGQARVLDELNDAPEVQTHMLTLLGEIYFSQGVYKDSVQVLEDSLARQRLRGAANQLDLANTITQLGNSYVVTGRLNEAVLLFEESLSLHHAMRQSMTVDGGLEYAETLSSYGYLLYRQGDFEQAKANLLLANNIFQAKGYAEHEEFANALNNLASVYHTQGEFELARLHMRQAINIQKTVLGEEHSNYTIQLANFGIMLTDMELYDEADHYLRQALLLQRKILGDAHPYLASTFRFLGILLYRQGNLNESEVYLRKNLSLYNRMEQKDRLSIAKTYFWLGEVLQDLQRFSEAEQVYREMMLTFQAVIKSGPTIGRALTQVASLAYARGDLKKSAELYLEALGEIPSTNIRITFAQVGYAQVLLELGDLDSAENLLKAALDLRQQKFPKQHSKVTEVEALLGVVLMRKGQTQQAGELLRNAATKLEQTTLFNYGNRKRLLVLSRTALKDIALMQ